MKRLLILTLSLATMLALAAPVGAAKSDKPDKPGKPRPIDVTIDANLIWANAPGDMIYYKVEVTSSETIPGATVELTTNEGEATLFTGQLEPGSVAFPAEIYTVSESDIPPEATDDDNLPNIVASVTVSVGEEIMASDTVSVTTSPVNKCDFEGTNDLLTMTHFGGVCWYGFASGSWEIKAEPDYDFARRNPNMTMRDHVPGNWCMVGPASSEGGSKTQPETVTRMVDLRAPDPLRPWQEFGVCWLGGRGVCEEDDCYLPTGNPVNFILAAPAGLVTATQCSELVVENGTITCVPIP